MQTPAPMPIDLDQLVAPIENAKTWRGAAPAMKRAIRQAVTIPGQTGYDVMAAIDAVAWAAGITQITRQLAFNDAGVSYQVIPNALAGGRLTLR